MQLQHSKTSRRLRAAVVTAVLALALTVACRADLMGGGADRHRPIPDTLNDVRARVQHAQEEIAAAQRMLERGDQSGGGVLDNIREKVSGWVYDHQDEPTVGSRATQAYEKVKSTVSDALTPEKYNTAMHRLKVFLGVEDPTTYEKIRAAFGGDKYESVQDQLRHAFGSEPLTETGFWTRIKSAIGPDESLMTKLKRATGMESQSLSDDLMHRVKIAVGAEDPTVWERVRGALEPERGVMDRILHPLSSAPGSTDADHLLAKVKGALKDMDPRHQETTLERVKIALGMQEPGLWERLKARYGSGAHEAVESAAHVSKELGETAYEKASEMLSPENVEALTHKIKVAVGAEDPTTWEKIRSAISPEPTIGDKVRGWLGQHGLTREQLAERVSDALHDLDPARRESTLTKVKKAIGLEQPSLMDKIRGSLASRAESAAQKTQELLSGETFDDAIHKIKVAVGTEDPTIMESIKSAITPHETIGDKVRHFFGRETGISPQALYDRIEANLPAILPERRDTITNKIRIALGLQQPGLMDRLRDHFAPSSDVLSGDSMNQAMHQVKVALGAEDPTVWEKVKEAFEPHHSLVDRVKSVLGRGGMSREDLLQRISDSLSSYDPRRQEATMTKVKKALGLQEPSLVDKLKERMGGAAKEATEQASEMLRGSTYDDAVHKIKTAFGAEDPTVWEQVQSALHPRESIGDKVRHILHRDTGISREDLLRRVEEGLASVTPTRRTDLVTKAKQALGLEEPRSVLGRVKDRIGEMFTSKPQEPSIERAFEQFRSSLPENREEAYRQLEQALHSAKVNVESKASSLFEALGGTPEQTGFAKMREDFKESFANVYNSMYSTIDHLKSQVGSALKRDTRRQYLLESSKEENGVSSHYINDNGQESLDITGDKVESVDKLQVLNAFRKEFRLDELQSIPENASVQLHNTKRPHVLIKSMRVIDGNRYDYTYDDGQETLSVEWRDRLDHDKTLDADTQQRLLTEFRENHGLSAPAGTSHSVKVRGFFQHKQDL